MAGPLETRRRVLGQDHPDTGVSVHHLGCLYRELGHSDESLRYFEHAQRIWGKAIREKQ